MSIYEHYREHEHPFVDQTLSWISEVEQSYAPLLTHFLDPREQKIVKTILGQSHELIRVQFEGGSKDAERKRCLFYPYYDSVTRNDFEFALLEGYFPQKFVQIAHGDILGTLMSLGIARKTVGDIYLFEDYFQILVTADMVDYIFLNLNKIKNASIKLEKKHLDEVKHVSGVWERKTVIVASLRLDVIVKEVYKMSRTKAVKLIEHKRVKLNHQIVDQTAIQLEVDDLISVRGYGRSTITEVGQKTRKDNIVLGVKILSD